MRRKYNVDLINFLKDNAKKYIIDDLLIMVNNNFNETYTRLQLQKLLIRNRIEYKYKNKNKIVNVKKCPVGTEYKKKDGMTLIKIDKNKWQYKQRYIYEQYYHVKLTSDDYIIFLDQNRENFDINNLKRISRRESSILSNQKMFSIDKDVTKLGVEVAKLIIKTKDLERTEHEKQ